MNRETSLRIACSLLTMSMAGQAYAQSSANGPASTATTDSIEEIVITTMKRSETLQDVPAAVSIIGNERLTDLGVTNLVHIANLTTGVAIAPIRSRANIYIRGVGQALATANGDSNIALNLNGVYLVQSMAGPAFFDVERVEVLPGPQGTLYGRNSTGGVVNITSRTPSNQFGIDGFVEAGNYDRIQVMVGIDIPFSDTFTSRTSVTHNRHDGYTSNGLDDQRTTALRETLVWAPSAATKVTLVGTYTNEGGLGTALANIPDLECGFRCMTFDPKARGYDYSVDVFQGSLMLEQQLNDAISLTYIGGYSELDQKSFGALVGGPPPIDLFHPESAKVHSQEVRLNARLGKLDGIIGAYYFHENGSAGADLVVFGTRLDNPFQTKSHGTAVYGQGTYSLIDGFRVTGGLRYSNTLKSIDGFNAAFNAAGDELFNRPYEGRLTMERVDWKGGVEFDIGPNSKLYASIATGFTPGGFSTGPEVLGETAAKPFEPVKLVSYSGGVKNRFLDGMLTLNLEGFYYDYKNYQISARDIATSQNLVYNAEKSTVYGFQLDSRLKPSANGDLSVNVTYLQAEADTLRTPSGNFDGVDLPFSPRWTANAFYQHAFDLSDGAQIRANVNFKYTSSRWTLYTQAAPGFYQKSNTHTDLNLGYYTADDRWFIQAYVRNLEDKLVKTACAAGIPGPAACYFEPPRTYGVALGFDL